MEKVVVELTLQEQKCIYGGAYVFVYIGNKWVWLKADAAKVQLT